MHYYFVNSLYEILIVFQSYFHSYVEKIEELKSSDKNLVQF